MGRFPPLSPQLSLLPPGSLSLPHLAEPPCSVVSAAAALGLQWWIGRITGLSPHELPEVRAGSYSSPQNLAQPLAQMEHSTLLTPQPPMSTETPRLGWCRRVPALGKLSLAPWVGALAFLCTPSIDSILCNFSLPTTPSLVREAPVRFLPHFH